MASFRPQADSRYLLRQRLLDRLPEASGFVVWLEAPYGYGKSVLASQWAARLEQEDWRVVWLSMDGREPRAQLAAALGLPSGSPWNAVLDLLWAQPTLLVMEDLESLDDHEAMAPLLRDVRGLLLVASRGPLRVSELPRLLTDGRLSHLGAPELGFSDAEAAELFDDTTTAKRLWARTNGWPLPLHFASLTGDLPEDQALLAGMQASLGQEAWEEALLLATLRQLPAEAALPATHELARSGFVQLGESGFRLHPLVAESMVAAHRQAANAALRRAADRLPRVLYGEALERLGDHQALLPLLEQPRAAVQRQAPEAFLRWDSLVEGPPSALRMVTAGAVCKVLGRHQEAVLKLTAALDMGGLAPEDEIFALKELCWSQALVDNEQALRTVERGEALLDRVDQEWAGRFLSDASFVHTVAGRYDEAALKLEHSLARLPADSAFRSATQINLALNRWDANGDYDGRLSAQTRTLEAVWRLYPSDAPGQCRDLAMMHGWAGEHAIARGYFEQALRGERSNPVVGLQARAALAALDGDPSPFPQLLESAAVWDSDDSRDVIAMHAIDTLPPDAPIEAAQHYVEGLKTAGLATASYARRLARAGRKEEALRLLDEAIATHTPRAYQLYLRAARYSVSGLEEDLGALLAVTTAGARLLPGLVPLEELPRHRPELTLAYPLAQLLASSWKEAVTLRLHELPDLELRLLGGFELRHMGRDIELTDRQKQVLTLYLLGFGREEAAEAIWPDTEQAKQRNNMRVQLSLMRRALEPWGSTTFVLDDGLQRVDADHTRLLAALEAGDGERVMAEYREPFAAGLKLEAIEEHRGWLRKRAVEVLRAAAAEAAPGTAERYLAKVIELDPLDEETLRALLRQLVGRGRAREARRRYAAFAKRLMEEMGLEPMEETREALGEDGGSPGS